MERRLPCCSGIRNDVCCMSVVLVVLVVIPSSAEAEATDDSRTRDDSCGLFNCGYWGLVSSVK
jgi:hypothetical protein